MCVHTESCNVAHTVRHTQFCICFSLGTRWSSVCRCVWLHQRTGEVQDSQRGRNVSQCHMQKPTLIKPMLSTQPWIWEKLLRLLGRVLSRCVRVVSLILVSYRCLLIYHMYVDPPIRKGATLMELMLRHNIEYYFCCYYICLRLFVA